MKIDLRPLSGNVSEKLSFEIPDEEISERLQTEAPWLKAILKISGVVENRGEEFTLDGEILYEVFCTCDRCVKEISRNEQVSFSEKFSESGEENAKDGNIQVQGESIDLSSLVEDYLLLSVPSQRLCEEECLGLCLSCGCDLNQTSCECKTDEYNPKFGKLALLKDRLS